VNSKIFDQVINLNISGRSCPICRISSTGSGGNNGVNYDNYFQHGSLLSAYAVSAGLPTLTEAPRLYLEDSVRKKVDELRLPPKFVVLHCGANEAIKILPRPVWQEIQRYVNRNYRLPVVEVGLLACLAEDNSADYRNLCGRLSILESAEVIRRSVIYVGTDSGPAHLANAVGAYGIIALGWYHVFRSYTPYSGDYGSGCNCELVRHDGPVNKMPAERILLAIDRRMAMLETATSSSQFA
jgi:heptosyltransferase-3